MKERLYRACWDDGHDYGDFEFYSRYRAGSKANLEDAMATFLRRYGRNRRVKIEQIYLV